MADGPDDPKQKADKAWRWCERQWDRAPSPSQMVEAAVTASIEAALAEALAPVLERVARLEADNSHDAPDPEWERRWDPKPATPCATCGGARFVCDATGKTAPCMALSDFCRFHANRRRCPDCSKPAPSPEGETACTRHGQYRCPACAAGMVEEAQPPSPAESKGNGQWRVGRKLGRTLYIGDKCIGMVDTPELAAAIVEAMNAPWRDYHGGTPFIGGTLQPALNVSDAEYVRHDLLEAAEAKLDHSQRKYRASCRHIEELARENEEKRALLASAERRTAELEGANAARQAAAFANGRAEGRAESAARIAELEHALSQSNLVGLAALANARVEGREAGIREAAEDIKQHGWTVAHGRVLALLAPCATCNGARWVCDVSVDGASYRRKPCPDCSKLEKERAKEDL